MWYRKITANLLGQPVHQRSMVSSSVGNAHLKMSVPIWVSPLWLPSIVPPLSPNFFPLMTQPEVTISNSLHINYISFQLLDKLWLPVLFYDLHIQRISFLILWNTRFNSNQHMDCHFSSSIVSTIIRNHLKYM